MLIERLHGQLIANVPTGIILDVGGVGYGVDMPLSAMCHLPAAGAEVTVWTYTYVREDALKLFGFLNYEDRLAFETLLSVSGVGPKVALAILSTLTVSAIRKAIQTDNPALFETVPGIGKRLAEKILVDLKPKLRRLQLATSHGGQVGSPRLDFDDMDTLQDDVIADEQELMFEDLRSALENLGFKEKEIVPLLTNLRDDMPAASFQEVMRKALQELSGQGTGFRPPAGGPQSRGKEVTS